MQGDTSFGMTPLFGDELYSQRHLALMATVTEDKPVCCREPPAVSGSDTWVIVDMLTLYPRRVLPMNCRAELLSFQEIADR